MKVKYATTALPNSDQLYSAIPQVINGAERNIMRICRDFYQKESKNLNQQLEEIKVSLQTNLPKEQFQNYLATLKKKEKKTQRELYNKKAKKIAKLQRTHNEHTRSSRNSQDHRQRKNRRFRRKPNTQVTESA
jgi:hypothetical protein